VSFEEYGTHPRVNRLVDAIHNAIVTTGDTSTTMGEVLSAVVTVLNNLLFNLRRFESPGQREGNRQEVFRLLSKVITEHCGTESPL
jgi:hypothetical protein